MNYRSGVMYSTAGDIYIKRTALRKIILRWMVVLLIIALFIYPMIRYLSAPSGTARYQDTIQIPLANLPEGTSQLIAYHGRPVIVVNNHGSIKALSALCTYSDSLLSWDKKREELICPSQDARFDINGNVKAGLAPRPLEQIKVMVVEGRVIVGGI